MFLKPATIPKKRKMKKNHGSVPSHLSSLRPMKTPIAMATTTEIPTVESVPRVWSNSLFSLLVAINVSQSCRFSKEQNLNFITYPCMGVNSDFRIGDLFYSCLKHLPAAAIVLSRSSVECAIETKPVSNCEGARYIPSSSIPRKKDAKALVSLVAALSQSVTSFFVKKAQIMLPTRVEKIG